MKKVYLSSLVWLVAMGCGTTSPVTQASGPTVYIHDTLRIPNPPKHDTTTLLKHDTTQVPGPTVIQTVEVEKLVPVNALPDTGTIYLYPAGYGIYDDPQVQAAINRSQTTHQHIRLSVGNFYFSNPVLCYVLAGGDFSQSWCWISGATPAKDAPDAHCTVIHCEFYAGFAFGIQLGKNCIIENLIIRGLYGPPLDAYSIYHNTFAQWNDGKCGFGHTNPYAGIVIDPFSDPQFINNDTTKMYPGFHWAYISGMSRSGSTACIVRNCMIKNFVVGVLVTAVAQLNGESMRVNDCQIGDCVSAVAATQAQAKDNWVYDLFFWGTTHTCIDGSHWGLAHGDGSGCWNVRTGNIAGYNYEIVNGTSRTMPTTFEDITAEMTWKIGYMGKQADQVGLTTFSKCKFHLMVNRRSPDWWYHGAITAFENCSILHYDNGPADPQQRIVLNDAGNELRDCSFGAMPFILYGGGYSRYTDIDHMTTYYQPGKKGSDYDSVKDQGSVVLHIDSVSGDGWYVTGDTSAIAPQTLLITSGVDAIDSLNLYVEGGDYNYAIPVGYVSSKIGNNIYFSHAGIYLKDGDVVRVYKAIYKQ
jgi:hypothetical protein